MLKQIIKGEKLIPIKFHGNVKHLVFACNVCGKEFIKPESYFRKQSKKRPHACCFCSPKCRSKYLYEHSEMPQATHGTTPPAPSPAHVPVQQSASVPAQATATAEAYAEVIQTPASPVAQSPAQPVVAVPNTTPQKKAGIFSRFLRSFLTNK